jgi:hypothetical protein
MAWFQLGRATLQAGRHELTLVTPSRAPGENQRFVAGFDAIVLSREPFHPNGSEKQYGVGRGSRVASEKSKPSSSPPPNELLPEKTEKPEKNRKAAAKKPDAQPEKQPVTPAEKSVPEPEDFKVAPPREGVGGAIIDVDEKTGRRLTEKEGKSGKKGKKSKGDDKNAPSAEPMR